MKRVCISILCLLILSCGTGPQATPPSELINQVNVQDFSEQYNGAFIALVYNIVNDVTQLLPSSSKSYLMLADVNSIIDDAFHSETNLYYYDLDAAIYGKELVVLASLFVYDLFGKHPSTEFLLPYSFVYYGYEFTGPTRAKNELHSARSTASYIKYNCIVNMIINIMVYDSKGTLKAPDAGLYLRDNTGQIYIFETFGK